MTPAVPVVGPAESIDDIEKILLQKTNDFESINYVYIVDRERRLVGVLSIKEVFRQEKSVKAGEVMVKDLVFAHPHTDQERAAHLALRHNLKAIPVVDQEGLFLGAILGERILRTLYEEVSEDMLRLVGIHHSEALLDNVMKVPILVSLKHRLPWLLVGLLGGLLAAGIVNQFEATLGQNLILVAFIPLVVYMSDAVGTQMEAFIIRDLAIYPSLDFVRYVLRQFLIVLLISVITGVFLFGLSLLIYGNFDISLVLGVSLSAAVMSSVMTGLLIPYFFSKLKLDPANASGPIATIIQDVLSVSIYLAIASRWL